MQLRPVTPELVNTCVRTNFCEKCTLRVGCEYRWTFYQHTNEKDFEIWLQTTEIKFNQIFNPNNLPEKADMIFNAANHFRQKIKCEKTIHPIFSYF